jgi:prevent-host-death family protein
MACGVSITEAKGQLTELVRCAEAGDEVVLTRHGQAPVCLVPVKTALDRNPAGRCSKQHGLPASPKAKAGPNAARSQDFLYGDDGLPERRNMPAD